MINCGNFRSINNSINNDQWLLPCGAIALSVFNDTFEFLDKTISNFSENGISWQSDRDKLFRRLNPEYQVGIKWLENLSKLFPNDQRNEHFIVWMRLSTLPTFIKPFSRCIDCKIPSGDYSIKIINNYSPDIFLGEKYFLISKISPLGGQNYYMAYLYIILGSIFLFIGILILIFSIYYPRQLGDINYLKK